MSNPKSRLKFKHIRSTRKQGLPPAMNDTPIDSNGIRETSSLDNVSANERLGHDYIWIACTRDEFAEKQNEIQATLQSVCGMQLVDLHISDLLNTYIPSHYDYLAV